MPDSMRLSGTGRMLPTSCTARPSIITPSPLRGELPSRARFGLDPRVPRAHRHAPATAPFRPRTRVERRRTSSLVDVTLDPAQRAAISLSRDRALLALGEAGHGKTTVALHRLAHVWHAAGARHRAAVVVPTEGLARLIQPLLRKLGVDVEARTYDRWAARQARRAFPDIPRRESEQAPPTVARLKRDPGLRAALSELAERPPGRIDDDEEAPPVRTRALAQRGDLQHLFGDARLLEHAFAGSASVTPRMIADVLEHTRVQFELTTEQEWRHVTDRDRLVAVDRRAIDEGTASADAASVDVEDYAVLFELDRLRAERAGRPPATLRLHDVLFVDEAQDLAPLELALLGRSLAPGGTLIVAGDGDQQTDDTTSFRGWDAAMRELGHADHEAVRLEVSYRCPPEVVALARSVRDAEPPGSAELPPCLAFEDEGAMAAALGLRLAPLLEADPRLSVAVLCRTPMTARRVAALLRPHLPARLVWDGRFLPRGPVQVTLVEEAKGLEFDTVVVPDASAVDYPDTPAARRMLYVAVTRARHQAVLAHVGARSPLLP